MMKKNKHPRLSPVLTVGRNERSPLSPTLPPSFFDWRGAALHHEVQQLRQLEPEEVPQGGQACRLLIFGGARWLTASAMLEALHSLIQIVYYLQGDRIGRPPPFPWKMAM
jgi:hypothetical protein